MTIVALPLYRIWVLILLTSGIKGHIEVQVPQTCTWLSPLNFQCCSLHLNPSCTWQVSSTWYQKNRCRHNVMEHLIVTLYILVIALFLNFFKFLSCIKHLNIKETALWRALWSTSVVFHLRALHYAARVWLYSISKWHIGLQLLKYRVAFLMPEPGGVEFIGVFYRYFNV